MLGGCAGPHQRNSRAVRSSVEGRSKRLAVPPTDRQAGQVPSQVQATPERQESRTERWQGHPPTISQERTGSRRASRRRRSGPRLSLINQGAASPPPHSRRCRCHCPRPRHHRGTGGSRAGSSHGGVPSSGRLAGRSRPCAPGQGRAWGAVVTRGAGPWHWRDSRLSHRIARENPRKQVLQRTVSFPRGRGRGQAPGRDGRRRRSHRHSHQQRLWLRLGHRPGPGCVGPPARRRLPG